MTVEEVFEGFTKIMDEELVKLTREMKAILADAGVEKYEQLPDAKQWDAYDKRRSLRKQILGFYNRSKTLHDDWTRFYNIELK